MKSFFKDRSKSSILIMGLLFLNLISLPSIILLKISTSPDKILVNQIGFLPESPKNFFYQTSSKINSPNFQIINGTAQIIYPQRKMEYLGDIWGKYYYFGNFSNISNEGSYSINVVRNAKIIAEESFSISSDIYDLSKLRATQFFYYQRANAKVHELIPNYPGHEISHMDDGIVTQEKGWIPLYGGWYSAGDYLKFIHAGTHIVGSIYSLLYAYEKNPDIFNSSDLYNLEGKMESNSIPDIIDEALWGIKYVQSCILPNGSIVKSIKSDNKFVAPEYDTDQIVGTSDDRTQSVGFEFCWSTDAMWIVASFMKFCAIANRTGLYISEIDNILGNATSVYNDFKGFYNESASTWGYDDALAYLLANQNMWEYNNVSIYQNRAFWACNMVISAINQFTDLDYWDVMGIPERSLGFVIEFASKANNSTINLSITNLIDNYWIKNWKTLWEDGNNIFKLTQTFDIDSSTYVFFTEKLGSNSQYLFTIFALSQAIQFTHNSYPEMQNILSFLTDWIYGKNPMQICMIEGIGKQNLPTYHHRYAYIYDNPRGAVPGCIPNGYIMKNNVPYVDIDEPLGSAVIHNTNFRSNEPWLPHNAAFLFAFS